MLPNAVAAGSLLVVILAGASPALAACPITADQAAVYVDQNLQGACRVLSPGMYITAAQFGLPDNSISSLAVGANVSLILYNLSGRIGITGTSFDTFWNSGYTINYVGSGFNDMASSIQVKHRSPIPIVLPGIPFTQPVAGWFLGDSPANYSGPWTTDPQGLAHDAQNFYITNVTSIYRYPITSTLTGAASASTGIPAPLAALGCNHLGDLDVRTSPSGQSFLFVPVENCTGGPVIAVFRPNLSFVTWDYMFAPEQQGHASWLALSQSDGRTWVSSSTYEPLDESHPVVQYELDWNAIFDDPNGHYFLFGNYNRRFLTYHNSDGGKDSAALHNIQGGVFSDDSSVLYLSNGASASGLSCPNHGYQGAGIHTFRTSDFTGIGSSSNGFGGFNFQSLPCTFNNYEELEGIDFVNMWNRGGAFNGFLHGLMVANRVPGPDAAYIKHYNQ